jgi:FkbM family methyltransferase
MFNSIIGRVKNKYRTEGLRGLQNVAMRRLLLQKRLMINPVKIALGEILKCNDFTIVQIGAYVGNTVNDPLFAILKDQMKEGKGRLICVEPTKTYFDKLVNNYKGIRGVHFENVAISDRPGQAAFYRLGVNPADHGFPDFLSQLGSLKDERMKSLWTGFEADKKTQDFILRHRIEERVDCITFEELLRRHALSAVDLLQMDVEGYEWEILNTIDFSKIPIRFVNYESALLQKQKKAAERLMQESGFTLFEHGIDTFCYRHDDRHLPRKWKRALLSAPSA